MQISFNEQDNVELIHLVQSVTQVFSPLVILFAAVFAMLLGFFAKFSAIVKSIPQGVLGGVTIILYTLITITGVRIWVVNKVDFNGEMRQST